MTRSLMNDIQSRAASDGTFRQALETAWQSGGVAAAAGVARAHGFNVPAIQGAGGELSDLELEQVAGGKGSVWIVPWW